jgi:hypothetical protein
MVNRSITCLSSMHPYGALGIIGYALSARISALRDFCVKIRLVSTTDAVQGRIVSISRGSPPPKKR